ncbi:MAG: hypothetical protein ABW110_18875 [Steroidobacteraceae bacterium]
MRTRDGWIQVQCVGDALDYPGLDKPLPYITPGAELGASPATIRFRAPTIGEHTQQIMQDLGYSDAQIDDLRQRKVI